MTSTTQPPKKSTFSVLGLPDAFVATLLTLGLIVAVAPWIPPIDFGVMKIPTLPSGIGLRIAGPCLFIMLCACAIPLWRATDVFLLGSRFSESHRLEFKILNLGGAPAYIHSARFTVRSIYVLVPETVQLSHVPMSHVYDTPLTIKAYPYQTEVSLAQFVPAHGFDRFGIDLALDSSFLTSMVSRYDAILRTHARVTIRVDGQTEISMTTEDHDLAVDEFERSLSANEQALLTTLGVFRMHPWSFESIVPVVHFEVDLAYNTSAILQGGAFVYAEEIGGRSYYPVSEHNKAILGRLLSIPAKGSQNNNVSKVDQSTRC